MQNKFQVIIISVVALLVVLFFIMLPRFTKPTISPESIVVGFLDSVKTFQQDPAKYYGYLNVPDDADMKAKIEDMKTNLKRDVIYFPLFVNRIKYEVKDVKDLGQGLTEVIVEIRNVDSKNMVDKFIHRLMDAKLISSVDANIDHSEYYSESKRIATELGNELEDKDFIGITYTFNVIKNNKGELKIDLGDVIDLEERNKKLNALFFDVIAPGFKEFKKLQDESANANQPYEDVTFVDKSENVDSGGNLNSDSN